jgi:hypothetical protein
MFMAILLHIALYRKLFLFMYGALIKRSPQLLRTFIGLLYHLWMIDCDDCGAIGGMDVWAGETELLGGKRKNKLRGPYSASELNRLSVRHLSANFNANFCG